MKKHKVKKVVNISNMTKACKKYRNVFTDWELWI